MVHRVGCGLDDKDIHAAYVFSNLKIGFAVAELTQGSFAHGLAQAAANLLLQARVRAAGKHL